MSKTVKRFEALPPAVVQMMKDKGEEISVGDMFFKGSRGDTVIRIDKLYQEDRWANNDPKDKKKVKVWMVHYEHAITWDATEWSSYGNETLEEFLENVTSGHYAKITRPFAEVMEEANKVISGEISPDIYSQSDYEAINEERAIMNKSSKAGLIAIQKELEQKKRTASLIHKAVSFEMEKRKAELEQVRQKLYGAIAVFEKQVKKIVRVIHSIELYLGIDEELVQIQEGEKAPQQTPISFRQQVLFIDEEVGAYEDGGLDFTDIAKFDAWLTTGSNLDIVLPEKKGVVVLRPRRYDKEYGNPYKNIFWNEANHKHTYILIRNGDNVYRIYTEKLVIPDRLFPRRKELQELMDRVMKESWEDNKERIEDEMHSYKNRALLMQGLIDRTEIFHPLPAERLNIFRLGENEHLVNFIYDDEMTLPTGRKSFNDWWNDINESIGHGSRILITGKYESRYGYGSRDYESLYASRFYLAKNSYEGLKNRPDLPKEGVYQVEKFNSTHSRDFKETDYKKEIAKLTKEGKRFTTEQIKGKVWRTPDEKTKSKTVYRIIYYSDKEDLTIMYMPDAEASAGWNRWDTHERKVRTRFRIKKDDSFLINYDQLSLDDIDFYIKSRVDRKNYLAMMPILKKVRKHLQEEREKEQFFIRFVADRNESKLPKLTRKQVEERVMEAVNWWKFKNKIKRYISKDDALALKMIEQRITSKNYNSFEKHFS